MSPSATPATHSAAAPRATNSDQARHQSRPSAHVSVFPGCHPWFSSHGQYPVSAVPRLQLYRIPLISFLSLDRACKLCSVLMLCPGRVESKTKTLRGGVTQLLHFTLIKGRGGGELRRNLRLKKDKKEGGWWWPAEERDLANLIGMSKEKGGGVVHPLHPFVTRTVKWRTLRILSNRRVSDCRFLCPIIIFFHHSNMYLPFITIGRLNMWGYLVLQHLRSLHAAATPRPLPYLTFFARIKDIAKRREGPSSLFLLLTF
jgi:hypothetical protein